MKKINFPTKFKFETMKEKETNKSFSNRIYSFRDNIKACNGFWMIVAKHKKETEETDIISNEDLAYTRKKYSYSPDMPIETLEMEDKITDFDCVIPSLTDCNKFEITIDVEMLAKLAKTMGSKTVTLLFDSAKKPFYVVPHDNSEEIFALQMPVLHGAYIEETFLHDYLESQNKL